MAVYKPWFTSNSVKEDGNQIFIPDLTEEEDSLAQVRFPVIKDDGKGDYLSMKINDMSEDAVLIFGVSESSVLIDESDDENEIDNDDIKPKSRESDGVAYFSDTGMIVSCIRTSNRYKKGKFHKGSSIGFCTDYQTETKSVLMFFRDDKLIHRQWLSLEQKSQYPTLNIWWGSLELTYDRSARPQLEQGNLSHWITDKYLDVSQGKLAFDGDAIMAQCTAFAPYPLGDGYFEIYIENTGVPAGKSCPVVIGLCPAEAGTYNLAGNIMESIGYHGIEAKIKHEFDKNAHSLHERYQCTAGDRLGCGLIFIENKEPRQNQKVIVYFTKNGEHIYHKAVSQPNAGFYPSISLQHAGDVVDVRMGLPHPALDFEEWKREEQQNTSSKLPDLKIQDRSHDHEDDEIDGITVQQYRFPEELGGMRTDGTISPSQPLKKPRLIQCNDALSKQKPFFSMTVSKADNDSVVSIGITKSSQTVGTLPGYLSESVGYSNTGCVYLGARHKTACISTEEYDEGDVIGCLLDYSGNVHIVSFTKNGRLVGRAEVSNSNTKDLLPSIGFKYIPATVRPMWTHKPSTDMVFQQHNLNDWIQTPGLEINGNCVTIKIKDRRKAPKMLTAPHPLTRGQSFYSVRIVSRKNREGHLAIGVSNHSHVATTSNKYRDIRLRCHKGFLVTKGLTLHPAKEKLDVPVGYTNDVIGCGVLFVDDNQPDDRAEQFVVVYFTVNGTTVSHQILQQPDGGFYPIISFRSYGNKLEVNSTVKEPALPNKSEWLTKALGQIEIHKKEIKAMQKEDDKSRQNRPASPVERPTSHLNKIKVYMACSAERWNEATYIKAGLDSYGYNAMLLSKERVAKGSVALDIEPRIKSCQVMVCSITPEYCNSKLAVSELKLAQKYNKPILVPVVEKVKVWPPAGNIDDTLRMLSTYRIEMYSNFDWGMDQICKLIEEVRGKGYNAKEIHVEEGDAAKLLYTDAQKGNVTQNTPSDPQAFKKAAAEAERKYAGIGNTTTEPSPIKNRGNVQKSSQACHIL